MVRQSKDAFLCAQELLTPWRCETFAQTEYGLYYLEKRISKSTLPVKLEGEIVAGSRK